MRRVLAALFAVTLAGCVSSHDFYFVGRTNGVSGTASVPANGHSGGPITIALGGKTYEGQWLYMETGGSVGFGTATAVSGSQVATASGSFVGLPTGGNGSVIATASDGSTLRCQLYFSDWNLKGIGVCQDSVGQTYDLQIK
jgi:hypothetical protein